MKKRTDVKNQQSDLQTKRNNAEQVKNEKDKTERNTIKTSLDEIKKNADKQRKDYEGVIAQGGKAVASVMNAYNDIKNSKIDDLYSKLESTTDVKTKSYATDATDIKSKMESSKFNMNDQLKVMNEGVDIAREAVVGFTTGVGQAVGAGAGGGVGPVAMLTGALGGAGAGAASRFAVEYDRYKWNDEGGKGVVTDAERSQIFQKTVTESLSGAIGGALGPVTDKVIAGLKPELSALTGKVIAQKLGVNAIKELIANLFSEIVSNINRAIHGQDPEKMDLEKIVSISVKSAFGAIGNSVGGISGVAMNVAIGQGMNAFSN